MSDLSQYGYSGFFSEQVTEAGLLPARVTAVHKERYEIVCEQGAAYARLKTAVYFLESLELFPTVGDFVLIRYNESGDSSIVRTLRRKTYFSRRDPTPGRDEQAVSANFDTVFIMQSLNNDFSAKRLERYATLAWQSGATPVIVLTKADLTDDWQQHLTAAETAAPGVDIAVISAHTGYGLESLSDYLAPGHTVVFMGSSGVGKSSLLNALYGQEAMEVSEIREDDSRGRHTTTHRQMILLPCGTLVIDTPGMREIGMWDVSSGLGEAFSDVESFAAGCRFADCRHELEPGCAVKAAIENGELPAARFKSYLKLKKEAKYSDDKSAALRERQQVHKAMAKQSRQHKRRKMA